jgi:hypothetical protein
MSAATIQQPIPLFQEGRRFWQDLINECRRLTDAINAAALSDGFSSDELIRCETEADIRMLKGGYPSTDVSVKMDFRSWGPVIIAAITGQQNSARRFTSSQIEIPIARDLDGSVIAIFDEGRSFSAHDLTRFLVQSFRRCFPAVSLPC